MTHSLPAVWMTAPLSGVTLLFLRAMTKRTKPRHYQSLRQGNTQELPWHTTVSTDTVRGRVWSLFSTFLSQSVTQLTKKNPPASEWCSHNSIWQPFVCFGSLYFERLFFLTSWRFHSSEPCQVRMKHTLHTKNTVSNLDNELNTAAVQDEWFS